MYDKKLFPRRLAMTIAGVVICGISIALFKASRFGVDPFQTFANGVYSVVSVTGLSFGTVYALLNAAMLVAIFSLDKHYIGIATVINLFGIGYICDASGWALYQVLPEPNLWQRIVLLLVGIVILCISSSLYFTSDLGVSTYDAVSLILRDKKVAKFQYCRIGCDLICVAVGVGLMILGGTEVLSLVGIGTIVTAFFMGPIIAFCNEHISKPLLYGKACKK